MSFINDFINSAKQTAGNFANAVGQEQIIPGLPMSPTIGGLVNSITTQNKNAATAWSKFQQMNDPRVANKPTLTPEEKQAFANTSLGVAGTVGNVSELPDMSPTTITSEGPGVNGKYVRDMRYKQGEGEYKYIPPNPKGPEPQYAVDTPTAPLNPKAEELPSPTNPNVGAEPKTSGYKTTSDRTFQANEFTKQDAQLNAKRNIQINQHDVKTPNDVNQINATLDGYGVKGSMTEQLQQINDLKGQLQQQAKNIITQEGGTISADDLVKQMTREMSDSVNHNIASGDLPNVVREYLNSVYLRAVGADTTIAGQAMPSDIPGSVVQDMKTIMNADSKSTFMQPDPTKWTNSQTIARNSRDAVDAVLDTKYPSAAKLNNDMSDLYKSEDSLVKGANAESGAAQKAANTPTPWQKFWNQPLYAKAGEAVATVAGLPLLGKGLGTAIGGVASVLPSVENKVADVLGYAPKAEAGGPQDKKQVSHNDKYSITTPLDDGTLISEQAQAQRQGALQAKINSEKLYNPQQANIDQGTYNQNEIEYNQQSDLRQVSSDTRTVTSNINDAVNAVNTADPTLLNALSSGYDSLMTAANGKYAPLASEISYLEKTTGVPLTKFKGKDSLIAGLDTAFKIQQNNLKTAQAKYTSAGGTSAANMAPTSAGVPNFPQGNQDFSSIVGGTPPVLQFPQ